MDSKKIITGFTLVELLIGSTILAIVILILGKVFISNLKLFLDESSAIAITEANKIALDEVINQIRESQAVAANCTPCGADTSGSNVLILQLWPINTNGELYDGGVNFDYIVYKRDVQDNTLLRKIVYPNAVSTRPASNKILSTNVANLSFAYNNATPSQASEVTVTIKNSTNSSGKIQETERQSKAVLRNK